MLPNKLVINPGTLREKIQIINVVAPVKNSRGYIESTTVDKFYTRAGITKMKASNDKEAVVSGVQHTLRLVLRYNPKIIPSSYIEFRNEIYFIDEYDNIDFMNRVLRLDLKRYDGKETATWLEG